MKRLPISQISSIRSILADSPDCGSRFLWSATDTVSLKDALLGTIFSGGISELAGRSVLLAVRGQLTAALAIMELDGIARRLLICPPDVSPDHLSALIDQADISAIVSDQDSPYIGAGSNLLHIR